MARPGSSAGLACAQVGHSQQVGCDALVSAIIKSIKEDGKPSVAHRVRCAARRRNALAHPDPGLTVEVQRCGQRRTSPVPVHRAALSIHGLGDARPTGGGAADHGLSFDPFAILSGMALQGGRLCAGAVGGPDLITLSFSVAVRVLLALAVPHSRRKRCRLIMYRAFTSPTTAVIPRRHPRGRLQRPPRRVGQTHRAAHRLRHLPAVARWHAAAHVSRHMELAGVSSPRERHVAVRGTTSGCAGLPSGRVDALILLLVQGEAPTPTCGVGSIGEPFTPGPTRQGSHQQNCRHDPRGRSPCRSRQGKMRRLTTASRHTDWSKKRTP